MREEEVEHQSGHPPGIAGNLGKLRNLKVVRENVLLHVMCYHK